MLRMPKMKKWWLWKYKSGNKKWCHSLKSKFNLVLDLNTENQYNVLNAKRYLRLYPILLNCNASDRQNITRLNWPISFMWSANFHSKSQDYLRHQSSSPVYRSLNRLKHWVIILLLLLIIMHMQQRQMMNDWRTLIIQTDFQLWYKQQSCNNNVCDY
jgi:hypothetical protein